MSSKVGELEKRLTEKEREKAKAEEAVAKARGVLQAAEAELAAAKETLTRLDLAHRDGSGMGWSVRKRWKEAAAAVEEAERKVSAARKTVVDMTERRDLVSDEVLELQEQVAGPRLEALRTKVSGLWAELRQKQEEAEAVARQLVEVYVSARASAPERTVVKRSSRYLLVRPKDEAMREAIAARIHIANVEPGYFQYEFFRAMNESGPDGRFVLAPGQDTTPPPDADIEKIKAKRLPGEVEQITKIDLGLPVSALNGAKPEGKPSRGRSTAAPPKRITFHTIAHEIEQAAGRK